MPRNTVWVHGSNTASLRLAGVLVPVWQQVKWTSLAPTRGYAGYLLSFPGAVRKEVCCLGESVSPRCSSALREAETLRMEAASDSAGDDLGPDGLMSQKLAGYVMREYL